jgi:hypothetical protein
MPAAFTPPTALLESACTGVTVVDSRAARATTASGVAAKLSIARRTPAKQRVRATKARGLKIPD